MELLEYGNAWIWHPDYIDAGRGSAGRFLHFRKTLYVNKRFVHGGPVKGDEKRWFYDTINIAPFLQQEENHIAVHVLRFYQATTYAWTFARTPIGSLHIRSVDSSSETSRLNTDDTWKVAIDSCSNLRIDEPFDDFMNIFERVDKRKDSQLAWVNASMRELVWGCRGVFARA
ncbi:hypothetical protein FOXYS1_2767 [Fusarium oxysporum]|uniref:Uncharacterized protein n=1 Tax=Fusarium oxysporum TaxID=5507 RepID=A0A8H5AJW4_FUSOX|nr:hypothetical protein FOXYS1_2767 [Fusarium oxysporum]